MVATKRVISLSALLIITQLFIPVGEPAGEPAGKGNTINWIEPLLNVGWSFSQSQVHLYFPSSASVTLKMVIMKSVLHFVLVFLSWISYFSPDFKDVKMLLKYHCNSSWHSLGCTATRHRKLTLVKAVTKTMGEEICGAGGLRPIFENMKNIINK